MKKFNHITNQKTEKYNKYRYKFSNFVKGKDHKQSNHRYGSISKLRENNETASNATMKTLPVGPQLIIKKKISTQQSKEEVENLQIAATTIYKCRKFQTEGNNSEESKDVIKLKQYLRQITKACNSNKQKWFKQVDLADAKKQNKYTQAEKFMMSQLNFTDIDESKILAQKQILKNYEYIRFSNQSLTQTDFKKTKRRENEQKIMCCLRIIDKIYKSMQNMQNLGYFKKNNKYMINYCLNNRLWMVDIFLIESDQKGDNFSLEVNYFVNILLSGVKNNFSNFVSKKIFKDLEVIEEDLNKLLDYLQQMFCQKKLLELIKISDYIENKLLQTKQADYEEKSYSRHPLRVENIQIEKLNMTQDLQKIEQKYGQMKQISKVSRKRYKDLNAAYEKLQSLT